MGNKIELGMSVVGRACMEDARWEKQERGLQRGDGPVDWGVVLGVFGFCLVWVLDSKASRVWGLQFEASHGTYGKCDGLCTFLGSHRQS